MVPARQSIRVLDERWCILPFLINMPRRTAGDRLVMSPMEPFVAAGGAEALRNQIVFEPGEVSQADDVTVKCLTSMDARTSLDDFSVQLMAQGAGAKALVREHPMRERT